MLTYEVSYNTCSECFSVFSLKERINKALYNLGRRLYKNKVLLLSDPVSKEKIKILSYYKDLLENFSYNAYYYGNNFPLDRIDSRIKELVNGL